MTNSKKSDIRAYWRYDPNANDFGIGGWCCSKCGYKLNILGTDPLVALPIWAYAGTQYCGNCGEKMDTTKSEEIRLNLINISKSRSL